MTKRVRTILLVVVAFVLVAATPATACGPHRMKVGIEGQTVGFNPDPTAVAERCPDGFEWILQTAGTGYLKTAAYHGEVAFRGEHCSRWLTPPVDRALGQIGDGLMVLTTTDGDELWVAYEGYFKFKGDTATEWISRVKARYSVVGGTGTFEDAEGRGMMRVIDETNVTSGWLRGGLVLDR